MIIIMIIIIMIMIMIMIIMIIRRIIFLNIFYKYKAADYFFLVSPFDTYAQTKENIIIYTI